MAEERNLPDHDQKLKEENDFLKMKLMLERGAFFGEQNVELPAGIENQFLNNVMTFEKQFEERKTIKLFDKINRPQHFKSVADVPEEEINEAYNSLLDYLHRYSIDFSVCSPNISTRELYRFITEELFEHETDDMDLPGWITGFIYDEFHPDPIYDNTTAAEDCINEILRKEPMEWTPQFRDENLQLNEHSRITIEEFKNVVKRFKMAYNNIEINFVKTTGCSVCEEKSWVNGDYKISVTSANDRYALTGGWKIAFEKNEDFGYWYINSVQVDGINF